LTLIVFFNAETTQTTNMAIILIGSALMAFYIGILLLFAAVDLLREYKYPPVLIWPRREFSFRYILVAAVNCVLIIGFLLRFSDRQEVNLLFVTAVDLVLSVFTTILVLTRKRLPDFISGCETLFQTKFRSPMLLRPVCQHRLRHSLLRVFNSHGRRNRAGCQAWATEGTKRIAARSASSRGLQ
jgi:hypothetical protein